MKNSSKKLFILLILFATVLLFSMLTVSAAGSCTPQTFKTTDNDIQIEAKYKKVTTNKITFNANGGKIGSKNTASLNIKKGAKINKFPATPKRNGHTFKGWYTKKSGGTKISVNTKPTKRVTYFAHWGKKLRTVNAIEKKLIGAWSQHPDLGDWWYGNIAGYGKIPGIEKIIPRDKSYNNMFLFKSDGTYVWTFRYLRNFGSLDPTRPQQGGVYIFYGDYRVSNGKIVTSNVKAFSTTGMYYGRPKGWETSSGRAYKFEYTPTSINVQILDNENRLSWERYYKR